MLIILDLDGVLVEASWKGLFEGYKAIIKYGRKDHRDFFQDLEGFKKWWVPDWRKNSARLGMPISEELHRIFYGICRQYVRLFPWVPETIRKMAEKHLLAIFTNRHREENAEQYIAPVKKYFSMIIGAEDVKKLKPHPEGIKLILGKTGFKKRNAVMIGDMPEDIMAGKSAGIKTGAVKWGLGDWDELMAYVPDYSFEEPEHLLQI